MLAETILQMKNIEKGFSGVSVLKKADLVWETKVKNYVYYELNTSVVEEILLWLSELTGEKDEEKESKK